MIPHIDFKYPFQKTYYKHRFHMENDVSKNNTMLETIVDHPIISTALVATAGSLLYHPFKLSRKQKKINQRSSALETEEDAHHHFDRLLQHYDLDKDQFELRCTIFGFDAIDKIDDKYVVFINMRRNPKKCIIQHELLHYLNGDFQYDFREANYLQKIMIGAKYLLYMENNVLDRLDKELLD